MNDPKSVCLFFAVVLSACGGETPPPATPSEVATAPVAPANATPPQQATGAAPAVAPGPGDWDRWSHDQKMAWMKSGVMPKMKQVFQTFDGTKYADFRCDGCHGAGVKDGSFKMPNSDLPKIPGDMAAFKAFTAKHAKMSDFMMNSVTPTMAGLVSEPAFDPKTGQGFGCMECHVKQ